MTQQKEVKSENLGRSQSAGLWNRAHASRQARGVKNNWGDLNGCSLLFSISWSAIVKTMEGSKLTIPPNAKGFTFPPASGTIS
ncbi:MAG: hypothetical protein KME19_07655 [Microcoleus vaginatus WJT46-NPBG5]|jgi:hypothetical protein|nr:hypothetical protein [Microcoleus vaginatus WJT46-NPBG5]